VVAGYLRPPGVITGPKGQSAWGAARGLFGLYLTSYQVAGLVIGLVADRAGPLLPTHPWAAPMHQRAARV